MAETPEQPVEGAPEEQSSEATWSSWSNLWQMPAIVLSLVLIGLGIWTTTEGGPEITLDDLLDQASGLISTEQYDEAASFLNSTVKPELFAATQQQRGRFHAIVADWISLSQDAHQVSLPSNNENIADQYSKSNELGTILSPERLERWANALIELGEIEKAGHRLDQLEALAASSSGTDEVRRRRNRVYRKLVEFALRQEEMPYEEIYTILDDFRNDPFLQLKDEVWVIGRLAELRIETNRAQQAIDHLLIEMRRLEDAAPPEFNLNFGELYVLLGRAYKNIGRNDYAMFQLERALETLGKEDPDRGHALVALGEIAMAQDDLDRAFELFDIVARDFSTTRSNLPGKLGRAEVLSIMGQHDQSLEDYALVRDGLSTMLPDRHMNPDRVARSLVNRHDASLTMGELDLAIRYIRMAESLFSVNEVPEDVLFRAASTYYQRSENLLDSARSMLDPVLAAREDEVRFLPPNVRHEANQGFETAAEYYRRYAQRTAGIPTLDTDWADALFMAGDAYDRAGRYGQAIAFFNDYVNGRSAADPRRPQAMYRLAQAYHAQLDFERASMTYATVIENNPRSPWATRSFVPLSRCLVELGRGEEAEARLVEVVHGDHTLDPDALDYRDALIELGLLYYMNGEYPEAVKRLDESVKRYPEDPRIHGLRYRLADSYRGLAAEVEANLLSGVNRSPSERQRLEDEHEQYLRQALGLFDQVCSGYSTVLQSSLTPLDLDLQRRAHLYRGDCAFELGEYDSAITFYDEAARKYNAHHSSVIALVQIVNSYYALGDPARAETAERRARTRLQQLPDEAFEANDALMNRQAWEQWLTNSPPGRQRTAATPTAEG